MLKSGGCFGARVSDPVPKYWASSMHPVGSLRKAPRVKCGAVFFSFFNSGWGQGWMESRQESIVDGSQRSTNPIEDVSDSLFSSFSGKGENVQAGLQKFRI